MKRRSFVRTLVAAPMAPLAVSAPQAVAPQATTPVAPASPARRFGVHDVPNLALTPSDLTAQQVREFFTVEQFAALERLAQLFVPALKGMPSALDAHAPEFLDFLIRVSPEETQHLYKNGLDGLNAQAQQQFHKPFAELDAAQADRIVRPLLTAIPWERERPADPAKRFIAQVHEDLLTATRNSREWAAAVQASGRRERGFNRSSGFYWKPMYPVLRL